MQRRTLTSFSTPFQTRLLNSTRFKYISFGPSTLPPSTYKSYSFKTLYEDRTCFSMSKAIGICYELS